MQTTPTNGGAIVTAEFTDAPKPATGITDEQAEDLKTRYGRIASIRSGKPGVYQIVFRHPKRAETKQYRAQIHEPARRADAQEALARKIVVGVWWKGKAHIGEGAAREALDDLLEEYPLAVDSEAASKVIEALASGAVADEEKG